MDEARRFQGELEFVQALANPEYLHGASALAIKAAV